MNRRVNIILFGGLGNQLFQYIAGLYVARKNNAFLEVDATFSQLGRTGHQDWLNVLDLPGIVKMETRKFTAKYFCAMLRRVGRVFVKNLVSNEELRTKIFRQYMSSVVGYDPNLLKLQSPISIQGYFQTWRYYSELKAGSQLPELVMDAHSEWFLMMKEKLKNNPTALGVHFRRGDYLSNPQIGTLAIEYYSEACRALLNRKIAFSTVWVFSDDLIEARAELESMLSNYAEVFFVQPPKGSHAFESILLMSQMPSLIIANSTFSWWGATLGSGQRPIVCPDKWFAALQDPEDLCPDDWIRVPSHWESN
jgi:hypothetical protein